MSNQPSNTVILEKFQHELKPALLPRSLYSALNLLSILNPSIRAEILQTVQNYITFRQQYYLSLLFPHPKLSQYTSSRSNIPIPDQISDLPLLSSQYSTLNPTSFSQTCKINPLSALYPTLSKYIKDELSNMTRSSGKDSGLKFWFKLQEWLWQSQYKNAGLNKDILRLNKIKAIYRVLLHLTDNTVDKLAQTNPHTDYASILHLFTIPTFSALLSTSNIFPPSNKALQSQQQSSITDMHPQTSPVTATTTTTATTATTATTTTTTATTATKQGAFSAPIPSTPPFPSSISTDFCEIDTPPITTPLVIPHSIKSLLPSNKPPIPQQISTIQNIIEKGSIIKSGNHFVDGKNQSNSDFAEFQYHMITRLRRHLNRTVEQFMTGVIISAVKIAKILATWYDMIYMHEFMAILPHHTANELKKTSPKSSKLFHKKHQNQNKNNNESSYLSDVDISDHTHDIDTNSDSDSENNPADFSYAQIDFNQLESLHQCGILIILKSIPSDQFHPGFQLPGKYISKMQNFYQHISQSLLHSQVRSHLTPLRSQAIPQTQMQMQMQSDLFSQPTLYSLFSTQSLPYLDHTILLAQTIPNQCICHQLDLIRDQDLFDDDQDGDLYLNNDHLYESDDLGYPLCDTSCFDEIEQYALTGLLPSSHHNTQIKSSRSSLSRSQSTSLNSNSTHFTPHYPIFPVYPMPSQNSYSPPKNEIIGENTTNTTNGQSESVITFKHDHLQWFCKQLLYTTQPSLWTIFQSTKKQLTGTIIAKVSQNVQSVSKKGDVNTRTVVTDVNKTISTFPTRKLLFSSPSLTSIDNFHLQKLFHYNFFTPHFNLYQNNSFLDSLNDAYAHINATTYNTPPQSLFTKTSFPTTLPYHYQFILSYHVTKDIISTFLNRHLKNMDNTYKSVFGLPYLNELPENLQEEFNNQQLDLKEHTQILQSNNVGQFNSMTGTTKPKYKRENVYIDENGNEIVRKIACPPNLPPDKEFFLEDLVGPNLQAYEIFKYDQLQSQLIQYYSNMIQHIKKEGEAYYTNDAAIISNLVIFLNNFQNNFLTAMRTRPVSVSKINLDADSYHNNFSTEILTFSRLLEALFSHNKPLLSLPPLLSAPIRAASLTTKTLGSTQNPSGLCSSTHTPLENTISYTIISNGKFEQIHQVHSSSASTTTSTTTSSSTVPKSSPVSIVKQTKQTKQIKQTKPQTKEPAQESASSKESAQESASTSLTPTDVAKINPTLKSTHPAVKRLKASINDVEELQHNVQLFDPPHVSPLTSNSSPIIEKKFSHRKKVETGKKTNTDLSSKNNNNIEIVQNETYLTTMDDLFNDDDNDIHVSLSESNILDATQDDVQEFDSEYLDDHYDDDHYDDDHYDDEDESDDDDLNLHSLAQKSPKSKLHEAGQKILLHAAKPSRKPIILPERKPPQYDTNQYPIKPSSTKTNLDDQELEHGDDENEDDDFYSIEVTPSSTVSSKHTQTTKRKKNKQNVKIFADEDD